MEPHPVFISLGKSYFSNSEVLQLGTGYTARTKHTVMSRAKARVGLKI